MLPSPWVAVVLAFGVYRVFRLIGWDDMPWVVKARAKLTGEHVHYDTTVNRDNPIYRYTRPTIHHLINCPYCIGFWLSIVAYLAWRFEPTVTLYALAPFALSAAVGLIAKNWDG